MSWIGTPVGSGVIVVDATEVKALAGITGTLEDTRIAGLTSFYSKYYASIIDDVYLNDTAILPVINAGVTLIVAGTTRDAASPESISAGAVTAVTSGTMRTEYGTQSYQGGASGKRLAQQGVDMIAPYLKSASAVQRVSAASPFEQTMNDIGGSVVEQGNLTGWDR